MSRKKHQVQVSFEEVIGDLIFFKELVVPLSIELGRTKITIETFLDLEPGSIIELQKSAGETLDVYANNYMVMRAEVTVIEDSFGLRITEITNPWKRI